MSWDLWNAWEVWEKAVHETDAVDESRVAFLLEEPDEYQLRRLLRNFPKRDDLIDRWGAYLFEPPKPYAGEAISTLASRTRDEFARLAHGFALDPDATIGKTDIVITDAAKRPDHCVSDTLLEALDEPISSQLLEVRGASHLFEVAYGKTADYWICHHLIEPLVDIAFDLGGYTELIKANCSVWLTQSELVVDVSKISSDTNNTGWAPRLAWPTDDDIAFHRDQEKQALDPGCEPETLRALLDSSSTFAAVAALRNPNLPDDLIVELASHPLIPMRIAAARHPSTSGSALAVLSSDPSPEVRLGVAANPNTTAEVIRSLSRDTSADVLAMIMNDPAVEASALERASQHEDWRVRSSASLNPALPKHILEQMATDDNRYVRRSVAEHPTTPLQTVRTLVDDEIPAVRIAATQRLASD